MKAKFFCFNNFQKTLRHISGVPPLHNHEGEIYLTSDSIIIKGDENLNILLSSIIQLYHGYDDTYRSSYVKNFGIFWQPLRVEFYTGFDRLNRIYLIINGGLFAL